MPPLQNVLQQRQCEGVRWLFCLQYDTFLTLLLSHICLSGPYGSYYILLLDIVLVFGRFSFHRIKALKI